MGKIYKKIQKGTVCHKCGKQLAADQKKDQPGFCLMKAGWGYFSEKDGETHEFTLCEKCYDDYTRQFLVPVFVTEQTEIL